jgi:hypothetical protein
MHSASVLSVTLAATLVTAACNRHDPEADRGATTQRAAYASDTTLRAGDVRIVDVDGGVELALIGDSISGGLSQQTVAKVKRETDSSTVKGSGFGASIEKLVKSSVASALATRITIPVADVTDIRYEDGAIRIETRNSKERLFEHTKVNDRRAMESFRPDDARRFVDAVRERKRQLGEAQ